MLGQLLVSYVGVNSRGQVTSGRYGATLNTSCTYDNFGFPMSVITGSLQNMQYQFNPVTGNLNQRSNGLISNLQENFDYDALDRLDRIYKGSNTLLDMTYSESNMIEKTDLGTMEYLKTGKPYQLSGINPSAGLTPNVAQSISYTSFESVKTIVENGYSADFDYNADNERAKMTISQNGTEILTRIYASDSYIKETSGGLTKEYTFIGGDAYTAPAVAVKQNGLEIYYYLLRDHLGSITQVVNAETNSTVAEYSYDAWGRMRNSATWANYSPGSEPVLMIAGRGYTGHEHLPWFNLINMNGRLYEPLTAQFLSPDNYVQAPTFSPSFNRYSYCLNNPLKYNDPSGEIIPFFIIPSITWSKDGGIDISITGGIGLYKGLSAQTTIGYSFGNNSFYAQNGISYCGATAYYGWNSQSGKYIGLGFGLSGGCGLSTNATSIGVSCSEKGGWSGNISIFQINNQGDISANPSISYSYSFNNFKQVRVDQRNRHNLQMAFNKYDKLNKHFASTSNGAYHGYPDVSSLEGQFKGFYHDAPVYEHFLFNDGSAITTPPDGIWVGIGVYGSEAFESMKLLAHEYGHWLQYKEYGAFYYYTVIAPSSLYFAAKGNYYGWTELDANSRGYHLLNQPSWWDPYDPEFPRLPKYDAVTH